MSGRTLPCVTMYGPTDTSAPSGSMIAVAASLPVISTFEPEQRMYWMPISSMMLRQTVVQDLEGDRIDRVPLRAGACSLGPTA